MEQTSGGAEAKKQRQDGLYLVLLGCAVFLLIGFALERASPAADADFRLMYYSARCVVEHRDPYQEEQMRAIYVREAHLHAFDITSTSPVITKLVYFPTVFLVTGPLALLPYTAAHVLWLGLTAALMIGAGLAIWEVAAAYAPVLAGLLVGAMLANSELFLVLGNPAGIVLGLSVIAVWCLVRNRYVFVGMLCMALCLLMKPHQVGLVWLFFLLAGGVQWRRAVQTLLLTAALAAPVLAYVTAAMPEWPHELHATMAAAAVPGEMNDPGPTSRGSHGIGMMISAQAPLSLIRDDPRFYNPAAYLLCAPLLALWAWKAWRSGTSEKMAWLALAPISALSMLPVYHRLYDARLMLLAVPACAMLWASRGWRAWAAVGLLGASVAATSGIVWAAYLGLITRLRLPWGLGSNAGMLVLQMVPAPLVLAVVGCFFLWVYVRRGAESAA